MRWIIVLASILIFVLVFLSGCVRPYIEGGLMIHDRSAARPEVNMPASDLGYAEIGMSQNGWDLYIRHTSSVSAVEQGYGINSIGVSKRIYLIE